MEREEYESYLPLTKGIKSKVHFSSEKGILSEQDIRRLLVDLTISKTFIFRNCKYVRAMVVGNKRKCHAIHFLDRS